jgi:hypothetical protein
MIKLLWIFQRCIVSLIILATLQGCNSQSANKQDVIGTYEFVLSDGPHILPDGGCEALELMADGICNQKITLSDGKTFAAQGTWEWNPGKGYFGNQIIIEGLYCALDNTTDQIHPDLKNTRGSAIQLYPVRKLDSGQVILGTMETGHYEKK